MATAGSAPSTIGAASSIGRILLAFLLSAATLGGSLYFSWGMQLKACPLCFYQRTFAMSLVAVLFMGLLSGMARSARIGLLALPLAAGGLGVALNHVWLEVGA